MVKCVEKKAGDHNFQVSTLNEFGDKREETTAKEKEIQEGDNGSTAVTTGPLDFMPRDQFLTTGQHDNVICNLRVQLKTASLAIDSQSNYSPLDPSS